MYSVPYSNTYHDITAFKLMERFKTKTVYHKNCLSLPPENIRKPMFSGGRERLHWERMS